MTKCKCLYITCIHICMMYTRQILTNRSFWGFLTSVATPPFSYSERPEVSQILKAYGPDVTETRTTFIRQHINTSNSMHSLCATLKCLLDEGVSLELSLCVLLTEDCDVHRPVAVEFCHAADLREGHATVVFKAMTLVDRARHYPRISLK